MICKVLMMMEVVTIYKQKQNVSNDDQFSIGIFLIVNGFLHQMKLLCRQWIIMCVNTVSHSSLSLLDFIVQLYHPCSQLLYSAR